MTTFALLRRPALAALGVAIALPALADELPQRRPGLWESVTTTAEGETRARQCVGAGTDQASVSAVAGRACSKNIVTRTAEGWTTETKCAIGQMTAEGAGVVTGDFETRVRTESATRTLAPGMNAPIERKMVVEAKRVGDCEAGQKPGDIIMPDGKVISAPAAK